MTAPKRTGPPWKLNTTPKGGRWIEDQEGKHVTSLSPDTRDDHARLIAAAPAAAAMLKEALEFVQEVANFPCTSEDSQYKINKIEKARSLLARAKAVKA
jgi:hypothetical protein